MWQIMCGYLIVAKTRFNYKYYMDNQRMIVYMLTVYIIHGAFGDIMLSHDLWLNVWCDFTYTTKSVLIVNVGCIYFLVANQNCKLAFSF
jgi:hypothetical protein